MAVETGFLPVEALAQAAAKVAATDDLATALQVLAQAGVDAVRADLCVVRIVDRAGDLVARAVAPEGSALGAEIAGTRAPCEPVDAGAVPEPTRWAAERAGAAGVAVAAARTGGRIAGSVELVRFAEPFSADEEGVGQLLAGQLALTLRSLAPGTVAAPGGRRARWLELAGEALAAGADPRRAAQQAVELGVEVTGARGGAIWQILPDGEVEPLTPVDEVSATALATAAGLVREAVEAWRPVAVERRPGLPGGDGGALTLGLGEPAFAALQLFFAEDAIPADEELPPLVAFATRVAHALSVGERAQTTAEELERTRALLETVGAAIAQLSLAHTLETVVERIVELLGVDQVGVYLRAGGRLSTAAGRGLADGHEAVAEQLLEAALGPLRARTAVHAGLDGHEPALASVRAALGATGQRSALAVPLRVHDELIGLLVAYPGARALHDADAALLTSLSAQLAVAVQNARLHERSQELGEALGTVLESERQTSRQVNALYEISRSFAQSLSLETTLRAVAETIVGVLGVDAAVIRMPDERGDQFVPRAVHVADERLLAAVRTILERPQPRPARTAPPAVLDVATARRLGGAHALLIPFLEQGSTVALLPIATPAELLAELTIVSLDPAAAIDADTLATAATIAQQAGLAIDNARLYSQQKQFAETMQQSLLPRERPAIAGLEVGTVYEPAAQVDVGGDLFDFLELADGVLAVVLGDVTGHGIDATADMAMAKFVFRSLAREHPEPSDFLAHANEVVVEEIAAGKFITMAYLLVDSDGGLLAAGAGHPQPRLVLPDATVDGLACGGLALGIEPRQVYEQVRAELRPGASVVLYTDGVIEARREGELFGVERLDEILAATCGQPAQAIADSVVAACRAFAGGELDDDCAIVVIKRVA
jgi:serine phosphatase RsbU (regulator of sigma subunit)